MKPRIVPQTTGVTVWPQSSRPENLADKVQRVTRDLHTLQDEVYASLANETGGPGGDFASLAACCEEMTACKAAVDLLRQALWLYLDAARESSMRSVAGPDFSDHQQTTNQNTETSPQFPANLVDSGSFFDRLNLVIEGYIQMNGLTSRRRKSSI